MSTKASPPTSSTAATTNAVPTNAGAVGGVKIKSELPSDEIKEYAENTMNELLGWYGFDGVDRMDLSAKTSRLLQSAAASASTLNHQMEKRRSRSRASSLMHLQQQQQNNMRHINKHNNSNNNTNNNNSSNNNVNSRISSSNNHTASHSSNTSNNHNTSNSSSHHTNSYRSGSGAGGGGGCGGNDSTTSDHDTRSSREDDSKSPHSAGKTTIDEKIDYDNCCWCRRPVADNAPEFLTTTDGPRYCSESCFTQSRRASFKKAKTCDWCKHVRHAVSYVDFQDGASQLQFCSDKCLNQYKMQIFCKETQAHLDMNPHLRDQGLEAAAAGNSAGLITPDLWLRNCRSRSASPASTTMSVSPGPSGMAACRLSPTPPVTSSHNTSTHKPMISVAPVSKLMSKSPGIMNSRQSPKHSRKKRPMRACVAAESSSSAATMKSHASLRREVGNLSAAGASQLLSGNKSLLSVNKTNSLHSSPSSTCNNTNVSSCKEGTQSLNQFAAASVQDLHMSVPPLSPMLEQQQLPPSTHAALTHSAGVPRGTNIPPSYFATPPGGAAAQQTQQPPPPGFAARPPPFFSNHAFGMGFPRFWNAAGYPHMQQHPPPPPQHMMQPDVSGGGGFAALFGAPPPVTVMVPYPIIIPLPIPIPVPLPLMSFYKAHLTPEQREKLKVEEEALRKSDSAIHKIEPGRESPAPPETVATAASSDEPLDFTTTKEDYGATKLQEDATPTASTSAVSTDLDTTLETMQHVKPPAVSPDKAAAICTEDVDATYVGTAASTDEAQLPDQITTLAPPDAATRTDEALHSAEEVEEETTQKLPKLKITRLHTKRTLIQTKESECSRPLRKRKRIIDCDFQKISLSKDTAAEAEAEADNACHNQSKNSSSSSGNTNSSRK